VILLQQVLSNDLDTIQASRESGHASAVYKFKVLINLVFIAHSADKDCELWCSKRKAAREA
jgi:hypothetical protein